MFQYNKMYFLDFVKIFSALLLLLPKLQFLLEINKPKNMFLGKIYRCCSKIEAPSRNLGSRKRTHEDYCNRGVKRVHASESARTTVHQSFCSTSHRLPGSFVLAVPTDDGGGFDVIIVPPSSVCKYTPPRN